MKALAMLLAPAALIAASMTVTAPASAKPAVYRGENVQLLRAAIRTPRIRQRINNQARRIRVGVVRGDLTRREAIRVRSGLSQVRRRLRRARRDGIVTRRERVAINGLLNRNGRVIYRLRNNRRFR